MAAALRVDNRFTVPQPNASLYIDIERVQFSRVRRRSGGQSAEDVRLRRAICAAVADKAKRIAAHLSRRLPRIYRIEPQRFWELSVECAQRTLASEAPPLAEFAELTDADTEAEPYGKPPRQIEEIQLIPPRHYTRHSVRQDYADAHLELRLACIRRGLHRLINVRFLRGIMVQLNAADAWKAAIDRSCGGPDSSQYDVEWRTSKQQFAGHTGRRVPRDTTGSVSVPDAHNHRMNRAWLEESSEAATGREDARTRTHPFSRAQCFPHMSQRAYWSTEALQAALRELGRGRVGRSTDAAVVPDYCRDLETAIAAELH